jgi:hypothetical protein
MANREPTILGALLALLLLPVLAVATWIGRVGEKLTAWKGERDG